MDVKKLVIFCIFLHQTICQTCMPYLKSTSFDELVVQSPIVIEANLAKVKLQSLQNITAVVHKTFPTRNDGLKSGSTIRFGPVGKSKGCMKVKSGNLYTLFLKKSSLDSFYWIIFNPVKRSRKTSKSLRKLLCKNCLVQTSFEKTTKKINKEVGSKLKIRCKAKGKPTATILWFRNGELLASSSKTIKIKTRRNGGSSILLIKKLTMKHNNNVFVCSATNVVSETSANFTVKVKVSEPFTCKGTCTKEHVNYCFNGGCCQMSNASPRCVCPKNYIGIRCGVLDYRRTQYAVNQEQNYGHQKRLLTILGLCLSLTLVMFVCLSVYCMFKKRRQKMLYGLSQILPLHNKRDCTLLKSNLSARRSSHKRSDPSLVNGLTQSLVSEASHESTKIVFEAQGTGHKNQIQSSPTHFQQLARNASLNSTKRKRLNGVAKNTIQHISGDEKSSTQSTVSPECSQTMQPQVDGLEMVKYSSISNFPKPDNIFKKSDNNGSPLSNFTCNEHVPQFSRTYLRSLSEPPITEELYEQFSLLNQVLSSEVRIDSKHF